MSDPYYFFSGALFGATCFWLCYRYKMGNFQKLASDILFKAEKEASQLKSDALLAGKEKLIELQTTWNHKWQLQTQKIGEQEAKLKARQDQLANSCTLADNKLSNLKFEQVQLQKEQQKVEKELLTMQQERSLLLQKLENSSKMTEDEAKELLLKELKEEVTSESAQYIRKIYKNAEQTAEAKVQSILTQAMQRLAGPLVSAAAVNTVSLPNEDMKARIIGRDGKNIRTLERLTGVSFIIDDTPLAVVLSCFNPCRLHIAKEALTELVQDGRIYPTRIEEVVEKVKALQEKKITEYGEDAAIRTAQTNLHSELITLLGKLKFCSSFGQNVLDHSIEVSHLMGMVATEMRLDVAFAKRIGLLHDIGKAVNHEIEGTHALIGHDMALKFGESKEVANGIGCHHGEIVPCTIEASFLGAIDGISAMRPGARIEAIEEYIKRVKNIEEIAKGFKGVENAYACQAGRELFVVVSPSSFDDRGTTLLARDVAKKIEKELHFPGKIKVTVIREMRAVEYAL